MQYRTHAVVTAPRIEEAGCLFSDSGRLWIERCSYRYHHYHLLKMRKIPQNTSGCYASLPGICDYLVTQTKGHPGVLERAMGFPDSQRSLCGLGCYGLTAYKITTQLIYFWNLERRVPVVATLGNSFLPMSVGQVHQSLISCVVRVWLVPFQNSPYSPNCLVLCLE